MYLEVNKGDHRPLTLVFAKDNSKSSIKEALFNQRTVVYYGNILVGIEKYLKPIFENSLTFSKTKFDLDKKNSEYIQIKNKSEIDYKLVLVEENSLITVPNEITLYGNKTVLFKINSKKDDIFEHQIVTLKYSVENLKIKPNEGLQVKFNFDVSLKN